MERLEQSIFRARRSDSLLAVVFFNLDNLKQVNDRFGHEAGDKLLCAAGERLKRDTRVGQSLVARLGGDDFNVLLESVPGEREVAEIVQRLQHRLGREYDLCGNRLYPYASAGVSLFPRDGETAERLLKVADRHMYVAKVNYHLMEDATGK